MTNKPQLDLDHECCERLLHAARDSRPVAGLTHNFYRYPARFSPQFVRAAIEIHSEPGDVVLDPFVGGGTTLVEAMAAGRHAIGTDINPLATFIASTKTTLYSKGELNSLCEWAEEATQEIHSLREEPSFSTYAQLGYFKNLDGSTTWRLRKSIAQAIAAADSLPTERLRRFARCAVLCTAQWALDGRRVLPSISQFRSRLVTVVTTMANGSRALQCAISRMPIAPTANCINRSTVGLENEPLLRSKSPKLILTSPPYPGVHVLYHRWQIRGRRETAAPYWIAGKFDGSGAMYYTMGGRHSAGIEDYFDKLLDCFRSIATISNKDTTIIQVVAFAKPSSQLSRYLSVAREAGLVEYFLPSFARLGGDRRLWRIVPNRKWHADQKGRTPGCNEVILFHRRRF